MFTFANGGWVDSTGVFTAAGANLSGVSVGMFASVHLDAATVGVFIGRITAVNDTLDTITVSLTAKSGTPPTTGVTGRSIVVGGVLKGPDAAQGFPFGFVESTMTNAAGDFPRVNLKNNAQYNITSGITHGNAGPIRFKGYTTAPGDGGKATIDGGTSGASYALLTITAANIDLEDIVFANNGATGTAHGLVLGATECMARRIVVHDIRGIGILSTIAGGMIDECEAYACNTSNSSEFAGITTTSPSTILTRCFSHDNSGSNSSGFRLAFGVAIFCIADSNGSHGFNSITTDRDFFLIGCDSYNNAGHGAHVVNTSGALLVVHNSNFVKNGGYGINCSGAGASNGAIVNCGFGAGTQANTSGQTNGLSAINVQGSVTYPANVTPWVDPANGDFRIDLAAAQGAGRGSFTQTQAGYAGTIGYPDIGAAQSQDAAGGGGMLVHPGMSGGMRG